MKGIKQASKAIGEIAEEELYPSSLQEFEEGLRRIADAKGVGLRRKLLYVKELFKNFCEVIGE